MDRSKSSRTITFRGGRIAAVLIVIAATLCLLLSVSAAGDAALPAWAEPYLLMDTVTKTEGSFFTSSTVLDGRLLFFAQYSKHSGLWSTDGTTAGTWQIAQHLEQWDPGAPVSLDTVAVFAAETSDAGRELWVTSGNIGDPHMLLDVAPGADSSDPDLLTVWEITFISGRTTATHYGERMGRPPERSKSRHSATNTPTSQSAIWPAPTVICFCGLLMKTVCRPSGAVTARPQARSSYTPSIPTPASLCRLC